jgi:hypothetical protein
MPMRHDGDRLVIEHAPMPARQGQPTARVQSREAG